MTSQARRRDSFLRVSSERRCRQTILVEQRRRWVVGPAVTYRGWSGEAVGADHHGCPIDARLGVDELAVGTGDSEASEFIAALFQAAANVVEVEVPGIGVLRNTVTDEPQ